MSTNPVHCAACGQPASGSYCSHCGAPLGDAAPAKKTILLVVPWAALGISFIALIVALVALLGQTSKPAPNPFALPQAPVASAPTSAPLVDLSTMTPREAADRLFNRVMAAAERGDSAEALRFVPMALQAYERLGTLDNDARYHVALIHLTAGDLNSARIQLVAIKQSVPNHLLALMLEHDIARRSNDASGVARANKAFLAAYAAEVATGKGEYQDHQTQLERFRSEAQGNSGSRK